MNNQLEEFLKVWNSREETERYRNALRASAKMIEINPELILFDARNKLADQLTKRAQKNGYTIDVVELMASTFDFGHAVGLAVSAQLKKDPNASAILFISECYEQALTQERAKVAALEARWWTRLARLFKKAIHK